MPRKVASLYAIIDACDSDCRWGGYLLPDLGDTWAFAMLDRMVHAAVPLLEARPAGGPVGGETALRLTEMRQRVLAGEADHATVNGVDRWIGGVHLLGYHAPWRWNDATESLTRTRE